MEWWNDGILGAKSIEPFDRLRALRHGDSISDCEMRISNLEIQRIQKSEFRIQEEKIRN
jgi:hypothetical protein